MSRRPYNRTPYNRPRADDAGMRSHDMTVRLSLDTAMGRIVRMHAQPMGVTLTLAPIRSDKIKRFKTSTMGVALLLAPAAIARARRTVSQPVGVVVDLLSARQHARMRPPADVFAAHLALGPARAGIIIAPRASFPLALDVYGRATMLGFLRSAAYHVRLQLAAENAVYLTRETVVDIAIPPGSTLVIDSDPDKYTVYLDGVNVRESYAGAWVVIDPRTAAICVDHEGDGATTVQIEYQERWI